MVDVATTQFEPLFSNRADIVVAIVLFLCFGVGTFLNTVATSYFGMMNYKDFKERASKTRRAHKKLLYNGIYFLNALNDLLICATILPVAVGFCYSRNKMWFSNPAFCIIWGSLWEILPYTSIMFVAALSITRTFHLLFPLKNISLLLVFSMLGTYTGFLVVRCIIPAVSSLGTYVFHTDSMYCFEFANTKNKHYVEFAEYSDILQLCIPVLPVISSCLISVYLMARRRRVKVSTRTSEMQSQASNTIVLITILYIVFNIPVVALCILYTISYAYNHPYHKIFNTQFLYWYSWSVIYIMGIALNSTLNPILYIWRMQKFREYFLVLIALRKTEFKQFLTQRGTRLTIFLSRKSLDEGDLGRHNITVQKQNKPAIQPSTEDTSYTI